MHRLRSVNNDRIEEIINLYYIRVNIYSFISPQVCVCLFVIIML